ncbi:DUF3253 domain-containing protein [Qipengyuania flavescens]|uniref:DUF3253 domain-containing protein n=1 Tax=Qipengyuania sp. XHP0211 TaxID=3038079 RepID=UPI00325AB2FD
MVLSRTEARRRPYQRPHRFLERRRSGRGLTDLEATILEMLGQRAEGATICPSEVARRLAPDAWRAEMSAVHCATDTLVIRGEVLLSWQGKPMPRRKGPYRIGRPSR